VVLQARSRESKGLAIVGIGC